MPKLTTSIKTLSWAAYLACSWTWCIGMFLPILLLRDYGPWGFVVFAVPNVLGAAAMGFVLTRNQSRRIIETHKPIIVTFSLVTITYHFFFLGWLEGPAITLQSATDGPISLRWSALITIIAGVGLGLFLRRFWPIIASAVLAFSMTVLITLITDGYAPDLEPIDPQRASVLTVLPLTPTVIFGFLLCPYLDATFHRALEKSPSPRGSFAVGFGALFLAMILLTTAYAALLLSADRFDPATLVLLHIALQAALTIALHTERCASIVQAKPLAMLGAGFILLAAFVLGRFLGASPEHDLPTMLTAREMTTGELTYRLFLSFYGLVFPAYVYLCMIPTPDGHAGLAGPNGRRKRNTWLAAVAIAAPFFWMGFIERRELFLIPGLAIVLLARLALPAGPDLPRGAAPPPPNEPRP